MTYQKNDFHKGFRDGLKRVTRVSAEEQMEESLTEMQESGPSYDWYVLGLYLGYAKTHGDFL